jgi:hypothetical protein
MPIDYSKYPPKWKKEIRPRILQRANNCCEFCGFKNHSTVYSAKLYNGKNIWFIKHDDAVVSAVNSGWNIPITYPIVRPVRVVLTIAHLDHDETNHEIKDERLAALCQLCHLNYDAKEKYRRVISKNQKI